MHSNFKEKNFFIIKEKKQIKKYVSLCEEGAMWAMQKRGWLYSYLFSQWIQKFIVILELRRDFSPIRRHIVILDAYKSHITLKIILKAKTHGVDLITLSSHISYELQSFNVVCFRSFNQAFKAYKNVWAIANPITNAKKTWPSGFHYL